MFVKSYGFLSVAQKSINIQVFYRYLSDNYKQKPTDYARQSATAVFKTPSKKSIQKTAEATDDLIGNEIADEIADKIAKFSKTSPKNNSEAGRNEGKISDFIEKHLKKEIYLQKRRTENC